MKKVDGIHSTSPSTRKGIRQSRRPGLLRDQRGVNVVEAILLIAILVVLGFLVIPNLNVFMGTDKKINAANVEAMNVRAAAINYYNAEGVYPVTSDDLWNDPPSAGDYIAQPHAYYTFDASTGRIMDASTTAIDHIPVDPWRGIEWDPDTDSWVKQ